MKRTFLAVVIIVALVAGISMTPSDKTANGHYHSAEQLSLYPSASSTIPISVGEYFLPPTACQGCHGFDGLHLANIDLAGNDVNLFDDWETSMMGLAGVDPFWRAKVSHEILTNPAHANELPTLCTKCHSPMGHYTAKFHGATYYTINDLLTDTLGLAGVACGGCHSIAPDSANNMYTGNIPYDTSYVEYGPFTAPMLGPMQLYVGLTPTYSEHMTKSRVCSYCHTLISNTVDLSGVPTGQTFVEQSTFHEWMNSAYPALEKPCQSCHMPQLEDPIQIANGITGLLPRNPFNLHQFAGSNSLMVQLIKDNKDTLHVIAPDANFDSTLTAINIQLTKNSLKVNVSVDTILNDTAYFDVTLTNLAGHKFPSGYPSRRAVLRFVCVNADGDTIFKTGMFDNTFEVQNISTPYEAHHNIITDQTQVQIYEMIMADVNGYKTTVLERAATKPKDNRIPPKGFTTMHSAYDTCFISGEATTDPDFNKNGAVEGTGKDIVHIHVALHGSKVALNAFGSVYYQVIPPGWISEMFSNSTPEIDLFKGMYNAADRTPVKVGFDSIMSVPVPDGVNSLKANELFTLYPTPTNGAVVLRGTSLSLVTEVMIYDINGKKCVKEVFSNPTYISLQLPKESGIYFVHVKAGAKTVILKALKL